MVDSGDAFDVVNGGSTTDDEDKIVATKDPVSRRPITIK